MKRIILILLISMCLMGCGGLDVKTETPKDDNLRSYTMHLVEGDKITVMYSGCYTKPNMDSIYVACYDSDNIMNPSHVYIATEFWENK